MRADRLLSLLLTLQAQGMQTAKELAEKLEVTERTIYRDIEALSFAGFPVFALRGAHGGFALERHFHIAMDKVTESEAKRLFINSSSRPLSDLGLTVSPWTNERLIQSLPAVRKKMVEQFNKRIYLDSECWFNEQDKMPWLATLLSALENNLMLHLHYTKKDGQTLFRKISPYGLVAKTNSWYLIAKHEDLFRVYRVSRIQDIQLTEEGFSFPDRFNISSFWRKWSDDFEKALPCYPVVLRAREKTLHRLNVSSSKIKPLCQEKYEIIFENEDEAEKELLSLGANAEVIRPEELRERIVHQLRQTLSIYSRRIKK